MGKVAENEKIKLRATLLNNTAVGLLVAAIFVPLVAAFPRIPDLVEAVQIGRWNWGLLSVVFLSLIGGGIALWAAMGCHAAAIKEIEKLED
jgi:hypothetical protein